MTALPAAKSSTASPAEPPTLDATMIGRLNHVAIAVPDLAAAIRTYADGLGASVSAPLALPEHGVTIVFVTLPNSKVELMAPLGTASPIAAFLDRNPQGGMHHVCFEVDDLAASRDRLMASGMRVLGSGEPKIGAHGRPVLFLHPKDLLGTLVELEEVRPEASFDPVLQDLTAP